MVTALVGLALAMASPGGAADETVTVSSNDFTPANASIAVGEKVTWRNTGGTHNVRFEGEASGMPSPASSSLWMVERTFNTAGTFSYYCEEHRAFGMSGTVTVTGAAPPDPTPGEPGPGTPPPPGGGPEPGAPIGVDVTLKVSDSTPRAGRSVRFFGSVTPALDGRAVRIQRRTRGGPFQTIAKATLRDAGDRLSRYSRRIRARDGVFRARVMAGGGYAAGTSRTKRVSVR
jgi:plastocyanin